MKVPVSWLREYVPIEMPIPELARTASSSRPARSTGIETVGRRRRRRQPRAVPRRTGPRGGQASECGPAAAVPGRRRGGRSAPDRLRRVELRRGRDRRRRATRCGAAERLAARAAKGSRRAQRRDDPRRGRDRARRRPHRDHGAAERDRAGNAARGRASAHGHGSRRSRRATTGPICSRSTASPARSPRSSTCELRRRREPTRRGTATSRVDVTRRGLRRLPALHRPPLPRRDGRTLAGVAQGTPACRGHAADLQRRRRDELRHARARQSAACLRLLEARRREDRRAPRQAGREAAHARRRRPRARAVRPDDRRRRARGRARGDHGRRGD